MKPLIRNEIVVGIASFCLIFMAGLVNGLMGQTPESDRIVKTVILIFFVAFGFCMMGLMLHAFILLQGGIGNANVPMVRWLRENETGLTFGIWFFLATGFLVALPVMMTDLLGWKLPPGKSEGLLVADVGMTPGDAQQRSSIKLVPGNPMAGGYRMYYAKLIFDFQIAGSAVKFPQSRYYWLETGKNGDPRFASLNIGITPEKMPPAELQAFQQKLQQQLKDDGWMPGHYVWRTEHEIHMQSGHRTTGDGRFWTKGGTLLVFEKNRMDDQQNEILYVILCPRSEPIYKSLEFEPSAWPGQP